MSAADSVWRVSIRSSSSAPRMPLRRRIPFRCARRVLTGGFDHPGCRGIDHGGDATGLGIKAFLQRMARSRAGVMAPV